MLHVQTTADRVKGTMVKRPLVQFDARISVNSKKSWTNAIRRPEEALPTALF